MASKELEKEKARRIANIERLQKQIEEQQLRATQLAQLAQYTSPIGAAGLGIARGATLGLSDVGMMPYAEEVQKLREQHPYTSAGTELAGAIGTASLLPNLPVGMGKLAATGAGAARGAGIGAAQGVQEAVTGKVLEDKPLFTRMNLERLLKAGALGGAIGGATRFAGAALGSKPIPAAAKPDILTQITQQYGGASQVPSKGFQYVMEYGSKAQKALLKRIFPAGKLDTAALEKLNKYGSASQKKLAQRIAQELGEAERTVEPGLLRKGAQSSVEALRRAFQRKGAYAVAAPLVGGGIGASTSSDPVKGFATGAILGLGAQALLSPQAGQVANKLANLASKVGQRAPEELAAVAGRASVEYSKMRAKPTEVVLNDLTRYFENRARQDLESRFGVVNDDMVNDLAKQMMHKELSKLEQIDPERFNQLSKWLD